MKGSDHLACAVPTREKLISICIPTFNRASYLPEALESILPQLGPDVELLVYDTGSTDGTPDLMKQFLRRFPSIQFFSLETKRGFDETALLLLQHARGEYVWLFGSDDVLHEGAVDLIRRRILESPVRPSFLFLNHQIVDHEGKLLIPLNVRRSRDREFRDSRSCVAWLGLHLGYISACVFRRDPALLIERAKTFCGSHWMGMHLNLWSISRGGLALYIGRPLIRARRNPGNVYDYGEVFCRRVSHVFWSARKYGIGWATIYRAMNRSVRVFHLRYAVSRRCEDPAELDRALPAMFRACWAYPWFWLLIVPVRLIPTRLARAVRDRLRRWRTQRNARLELTGRVPIAREQE